MSCKCQSCDVNYKVDVLVPDKIWEQIKPTGKSERAGLLCGKCIFEKIEALDKYRAYILKGI